MYDELTKSDLKKMQEEIDYRVQTLRPKLIEDVQTARAFGDLSENFEYKCAKQEKNRNDARVRYLQRMIKTAHVIDDTSAADAAGLWDTVEIRIETTGATRNAAAGCAQGAHQQGVPRREGRPRPSRGRARTGRDGKRPQLLPRDSLDRKGHGRRHRADRELLKSRVQRALPFARVVFRFALRLGWPLASLRRSLRAKCFLRRTRRRKNGLDLFRGFRAANSETFG